jgi:hypothetical protein
LAKKARSSGRRIAPVPGPVRGASRHRPSWAIVIALAAILTYANGLEGPFILDDESTVVQNPDVQNLSRLGRVLAPAANSPVAGRPLVSLAFAINYAWGGLDVTGYHVVNVALHALCAVLVFGVVRRTFARGTPPGVTAPPYIDTSAAAVALLWAVHPLNSEVVNYLTQRTESMMGAGVLLALYAANRAATSRHAGWVATAVTASAIAMASKETAVVTPVLVALHDRAFLYGSWREAFQDRVRLYGGLVATWGVLGVLLASGPRAAVGGLDAGVTVWTYLLNQAAMIV